MNPSELDRRQVGFPNIGASELQFLYGNIPLAVATNIVLAALVTAVLWPMSDSVVIGVWLDLLILAQFARLLLWRAFRRLADLGVDRKAWLWRFRWSVICTAVLWGLGACLLFVPEQIEYQVFLTFVLAGLSAGAITSLSPDHPSAIGFCMLILTPLAGRFLVQGELMPVAMGAMIVSGCRDHDQFPNAPGSDGQFRADVHPARTQRHAQDRCLYGFPLTGDKSRNVGQAHFG